jgi:hypothetical protein
VFDVPTFIAISVSAVLAIAFAMPRQIDLMVRLRAADGEALPSRLLLTVGATLQQGLLAVGLAAAGAATAPRVGLSAPWFAAVAHDPSRIAAEAAAQLPQALLVGTVSAAAFLGLYYRVFRPRLTPHQVQRTESLRMELGLAGRVLMGGVAEEVMFRWGVMSVLAWAIAAMGVGSVPAIWIAIVVSGVLFGLGHLPGAVAVGVPLTRTLVVMAIVLNLLVAVGFGWLFWRSGLLAAIVAHALVHVLWYPIDRRLGPRMSTPPPADAAASA